MSNNLIDVQLMKNLYNTEKQTMKLGLLNIKSLSTKALFLNNMITDIVLHITKAVNSTHFYKYGRTITSTTKECFVSNLPDLSQFLSTSNSAENGSFSLKEY